MLWNHSRQLAEEEQRNEREKKKSIPTEEHVAQFNHYYGHSGIGLRNKPGDELHGKPQIGGLHGTQLTGRLSVC